MIELRGFPAPAGALDLDVAPGELVLLQGGNGSGKTSLLRALAGLDAPLQPDSVRVHGRDPRALHARDLAPLVRWAPQDARDALVGLTVQGEFRLRERDLPDELRAHAAQDVATLSSGEARRVALAVVSGSSAPLLLLDEPAEGLDAPARERLRRLVAAAREGGAAVVAADHAGLLDDLAPRRLPLDEATSKTAAALPAPLPRPQDGAPVLHAPAARLRLGPRELRLPPLDLGAGLHVVVGANGSGKTTLLTRLSGIGIAARADDVRVAGARVSLGRNVRALPARACDLLLSPRVADELAGAEPATADLLVPAALRARHPLALSGGEQQRVALARTLGAPSQVYLLDEPEAHLDGAGRRALLDALAARIAEGACIVAATHDPGLQRLAHDVLHLEAGA